MSKSSSTLGPARTPLFRVRTITQPICYSIGGSTIQSRVHAVVITGILVKCVRANLTSATALNSEKTESPNVMTEIVNPFANQDLFIAEVHHDRVRNYVSRSQSDHHPFARQIDAWWAALTIGARRRERSPLPRNAVKFNDGRVLATDPWRIIHLELLALDEGGPEMLNSPSEVIRMASEFANAGFSALLGQLVGEIEPTIHFLLRAEDLRGA